MFNIHAAQNLELSMEITHKPFASRSVCKKMQRKLFISGR